MKPPRTRRARLLVTLTSLALTLLLLAPGVATAGLKERITATLERHGMAGPDTSVAIHDLTAKRSVYQRRQNVLRVPASNQKLVISAAALDAWTAEFRFSTQLFVAAPGIDEEGVIRGDVYLRGFGDPTLSTKAFQKRRWNMVTADIQSFVRRLRRLGVTRITGRVVADEGYFDAARRVANWRPSLFAYCGPLSALTLNASCADNGGYVADPALAAAGALTRRLRNADISVAGAPVRGVVPASAVLVHTERSAPLRQVLVRMNRPSDNHIAEELIKGLGAGFGSRGSTAAGAGVVQRYLRSTGIGKGFRIRDGSGLSYQNRLTARTILKVLGASSRRPDFGAFRNSLAVAGVNGTLRQRMRGTAAARNVRAKTGTLNSASCLSGYVTTANGHTLSFVILMNGGRLSHTRARAAQDAVAVLLARSKP